MPEPHATAPLLSIAMPTRNRPGLLERALGSVVQAVAPVAEHIEVAVSDGSDDGATGDVVRTGPERLARGVPVRLEPAVAEHGREHEPCRGDLHRRVGHAARRRRLPAAGRGCGHARRDPPGGTRARACCCSGSTSWTSTACAGAQQTFRRERYLEPREALRRLLRNSSFVREPTAVVRRAALEQEGLFDTAVGGAADTDMWVRLFSRYGVRCLPQTTCAYTIHEAAATTGMWNPGTIRANGEIFDRAVARGIVPERTIRRWQADWYHQFILAGAYRRLRMGRRAEAREVLRLFELPEVHDRGVSPKWLPVRAAFTAATVGARPVQKGKQAHERHADRRGRRRWVHRRAPGRQAAERGVHADSQCGREAGGRLVSALRRRRQPPARSPALARLRGRGGGRQRRLQRRGRHGRHGLHREQQGAVHALRADQHPSPDGVARRRRREFFFASSACVYAEDKQRTTELDDGLREEDAYPAMPEDGYGWEKLFSERMCRHYREDFGIHAAWRATTTSTGRTARGTAGARRRPRRSAAR